MSMMWDVWIAVAGIALIAGAIARDVVDGWRHGR